MRALAYIDGGCRPTNPGHAGFAAVIEIGGDEHVISRYIGWKTNNVAEYYALIVAIKYSVTLGAQILHVKSDSMLVVQQVSGRWRVKEPGLRPFHREACELLARHFSSGWKLEWIRRADNIKADDYCTQAIQAGRYKNPYSRRHLKDRGAGQIIDPFAHAHTRTR